MFCAERQFIKPTLEQSGVETDKYDSTSIHFGVYNLANILMGTVRLVRPEGSAPYPFESHCPTFPSFFMPPRDQCAEISRLAVARSFRRRRADSWSGIPGSNNATETPPRLSVERRVSDAPMVLLGLYREMYRQSVQSGIRYWYAAMERSLAHSLSKLGIDFEPIGPLSDYYGVVMPFVLDLESMRVKLKETNPQLAAWFSEPPVLYDGEPNSFLRDAAARVNKFPSVS